MLTSGDSIVIGLSGGADSVALLHALISLQSQLQISKIFAVHINHGLRGEFAANDEKFAQDICNNLQIPIKIYHANVRGLAKKESLTIEEAGRKLRYIHLRDACTAFGATKIATGHHQNDNVETVIMNLARGSGLRGLCGIPPTNGNIIRPLLDVPRLEIEKYLSENNISYITDGSNFSQEYARNRIRHAVLPSLEAATNPQVAQTVAKNIANLRTDEEYLESVAQKAYLKCAEGTTTHISLNAKKLSTLPQAISTRVIRKAITALCHQNSFINTSTITSTITSTHITSVLHLAHLQPGKEIHLPGLIAHREHSKITITTSAKTTKLKDYLLPIPGTVHIPELQMTITLSKTQQKSNPHYTKSFECGMVSEALFLRTRRSGDKITLQSSDPLSKPFTKKLSDYFADTKTPKHKRDTIPLIAHGSDILWVLDAKNPTNKKYISTGKSQNLLWISIRSDANE